MIKKHLNIVNRIKIEKKIIDEEHSCFVIAEAANNHNGNLAVAKKMVREAKKAGADAVKFQTFWGIEGLKECELTKKEWRELKKYCDKQKIMFLSTPHTLEAVDFLEDLVPIYKAASPFLTNKKFILKVASKKKPILLSTGSLKHRRKMAPFTKIKETLSWIPNTDVTLLHCVSGYPCLNDGYERIEKLKRFNRPVGLSDHTKNIKVPIVPIVEKHLILEESYREKDATVALKPSQFKQMVNYIRNHESIRC